MGQGRGAIAGGIRGGVNKGEPNLRGVVPGVKGEGGGRTVAAGFCCSAEQMAERRSARVHPQGCGAREQGLSDQ